MPTRRDVLAVVAGGGGGSAFAGCLYDSQNRHRRLISLDRVPPEKLGQEDAHKRSELYPRARDTVADALDNGTVVYGKVPLDERKFILSNGSYFAVNVTRNGTETVTRPVLEAESVPTANGSVGDVEDLARHDEPTLKCAISNSDNGDGDPCVIYGGNDSAFWPELQFRYWKKDDTYYRLSSSEQRVSLPKYDYRLDRIAGNRSEFVDYVARNRVAIDFSKMDLSDNQREMLRLAAKNDSYWEDGPYSDAFMELYSMIDEKGGGPYGRDIYVRFEGSFYKARAWSEPGE